LSDRNGKGKPVSTDRQGRSGLSLEAQRVAVAAHLAGGAWMLLDEIIKADQNLAQQHQLEIEAVHTQTTLALVRFRGGDEFVTQPGRR